MRQWLTLPNYNHTDRVLWLPFLSLLPGTNAHCKNTQRGGLAMALPKYNISNKF